MFWFILIVIVIVAYFIYSNKLYQQIMTTNSKKNILNNNNIYKNFYEYFKDYSLWMLEQNPKSINIEAKDKTKLHGLFFNNNSNRWVITIHDFFSNSKNMAVYVKRFYEMGYNVLALDLRGNEYVRGNYFGMGYKDSDDVLEWIKYILNVNNQAEIILHGVGLGAATAVFTAKKMPDNIKFIIADSCYTSLNELIRHNVEEKLKIKLNFFILLLNTMMKIRNGFSVQDVSLVQALDTINTPIIFINGKEDNFTPLYMMEELSRVSHEPKFEIVIRGAKHGMSIYTDQTSYWGEIERIIHKKNLNE